MIELDSEFANDEHRAVAAALRKSTSQLVRYFYKNKEAFLKLQQHSDNRSPEYAGFIDFTGQIQDLYQKLLTTPKEEQDSMTKQIQILQNHKLYILLDGILFLQILFFF